jgi:peptidylprolyl isomerase
MALTGVLVLGLALAGCAQPSVESASQTAPVPSISVPDGTVRFAGVSVSGSTQEKPTFLIGDETQSTASFTVYDVVEGSGTQATKTDKVTVNYVGRSAKTKRQFDSSWDRGTPYVADLPKLTFAAFTQGVPGMRPGGRRLVVVPGPLAFGATPPQGSGLGPNETLVYVIDLVSVG